MKFTCSVEINAPLNKVVELFDNTDNLKKWQEGFVSFDTISGMPGTPGAKSKIVYNSGKHVIELTETIKTKDLPKEMSAFYEHKHMDNFMSNQFSGIDSSRTKMEMHVEYTRFGGIMPKLIAVLMPSIFKKQSQKWLENFKAFVEKNH